MKLEDLVKQETITDKLVQKAHSEIWNLKRLREMRTVRECAFEDEHGCENHFNEEATACLDEIIWVIKKQFYKQIQNAINEATAAYTGYCDMCKECNLEPKKFDMNFSYDIDRW